MVFLEKILTDQGHNFESDLLKALCKIVQVKKIRTCRDIMPQTNGQCETFQHDTDQHVGYSAQKT